ncbi:hypothetical protein B484DRAFT_110972 [Ochromonadaceae sp. CCMP2298]|nr:hypothetical protein B484DRAFT_110972 [Ochromonadaceae sp. CCMP2298]
MMDKKLFSALSRHQRMAVKLRASEKRILQTTIKAVQEELFSQGVGGPEGREGRGEGGGSGARGASRLLVLVVRTVYRSTYS